MNNYAEIDHLLRTTSEAFRAALHAVLDGDKQAARDVLHRSAGRRALVTAARDTLTGRAWVPAPQLANELQFVADIGRVGELVDQLARQVVAGVEHEPLSPTRRLEVSVLLDAGTRRLRQLADGPIGPGLDPEYRGCGCALFEVADRGAHDRSSTMARCSALAATLLQASRHAARAA